MLNPCKVTLIESTLLSRRLPVRALPLPIKVDQVLHPKFFLGRNGSTALHEIRRVVPGLPLARRLARRVHQPRGRPQEAVAVGKHRAGTRFDVGDWASKRNRRPRYFVALVWLIYLNIRFYLLYFYDIC